MFFVKAIELISGESAVLLDTRERIGKCIKKDALTRRVVYASRFYFSSTHMLNNRIRTGSWRGWEKRRHLGVLDFGRAIS